MATGVSVFNSAGAVFFAEKGVQPGRYPSGEFGSMRPNLLDMVFGPMHCVQPAKLYRAG